jgi:hypothetical protein
MLLAAPRPPSLLPGHPPTEVAESIGRDLLVYGRRLPKAELFARIDAVDADTVGTTTALAALLLGCEAPRGSCLRGLRRAWRLSNSSALGFPDPTRAWVLRCSVAHPPELVLWLRRCVAWRTASSTTRR